MTGPHHAHETTAEEGQGPNALRQLSLKLAGYLYLVGDVSLSISGVLKREAGTSLLQAVAGEAKTGAIWAAGGLAAARYGNENAERIAARLGSGLGAYLREQGIDIPEEAVALTRRRGLLEKAEDFAYRHPSELLNASYAVGSSFLIRDGLREKERGGVAKRDFSLVTSGTLVAGGALSGLLIPEYETPPEHLPTDPLGKAVHWLREKPLRFSGGLYALNNVAMVASAITDKRDHPDSKGYLFKFLTVGCYVAANALLAISPRERGKDDAPLDIASLEQAAAAVVVAQSPDRQGATARLIAEYLAAQPAVRRDADAVVQGIAARLRAEPVLAAVS